MKKILSSIIATLLFLTLFFPLNAKASNPTNSSQQELKTFASQVNSTSYSEQQIINPTNNTTYQNSSNDIASGTIKIGEQENPKLRSTTTIGTIRWRISNQYLNGKSQFTYHIDALTGVKPASLSVSLNVVLQNGTTDIPTPYGGRTFTFNAAEIKTGASKSAEVDATTGYLTVFGAFTALAPDGTPNYFPITPRTILTNKLNEYFPNYIDPISNKQAITGIRTDWAKTGSHPWSGRATYIKNFEAQYGKQSEAYWQAVQIHHIRPRNFGGDDSYNNLMPVETNSHRLITKWFVNY